MRSRHYLPFLKKFAILIITTVTTKFTAPCALVATNKKRVTALYAATLFCTYGSLIFEIALNN